jgi:hypothetical protein
VDLVTQQVFQDKPLEQRRKTVRQIIARMLMAYGFKETKALASQFNCTYGAIKNWGSNGRLPTDPMFTCHMQTGASLDWLMNGKSAPLEFSQQMVDKFTSHIKDELTTAARYQLVNFERPENIKAISSGLSESIMTLLDIKQVEDIAPYVKSIK